jgi:hypothetical protein
VHLGSAARAGVAHVGAGARKVPPIDGLASELAAAVVGALRRKLEEDVRGVESIDDSALGEHVGAAFREWRGPRIEGVASDFAVAAFSLAMREVGDNELRWIFDDGGMECPDCEDNALAGPLVKGEAFPTGHLHPPAHPGCRCLLAEPLNT